MHLNAIVMSSETDRFCTLVLLRLRRSEEGWQVTSSSGGHPLPVHLRPGLGPAKVGEPGMIVGAFDDAYFSETTTSLGVGESLFLYTDGVTEAGGAGNFFGEDGLFAVLAEPASTPGLIVGVLDRVLEFQHQVPRDDIALLAIRATD